MILADTSVWVDHLGARGNRLGTLLEQEQIVLHPMVIGELACGNLTDRSLVLNRLHQMPRLAAVTDEAAEVFIETYKLMGKGIGFIDVHLLAAVAAAAGARLWTRDKRLAHCAGTLGFAFSFS